VHALDLKAMDRGALAFYPDRGLPVLARPTVLQFWQDVYHNSQNLQTLASSEARHPPMICQVTGQTGPISVTVSSRVRGLMGIDCLADAYLVTGLESAESYGLEGAASAMVSADGLDVVVRAANALIADQLSQKPTHYKLGHSMLLFWTRNGTASGFETAFSPTPETVAELLGSPAAGRVTGQHADLNEFYLLAISGNTARIVVRDYLESPLSEFQMQLGQWFRDLAIVPHFAAVDGGSVAPPSIRSLAEATALDLDHVQPDVPLTLARAAVRGDPLPLSILAACLARLRVGGSDAFIMSRMALVKVVLLRRRIPVSDSLDLQDHSPAYICGRLLALFEQIQFAALGEVNANVVDKYFGTFSTAPAMLLGRLYANAQNHLRKLKAERYGAFVNLDRSLSELTTLLATPPRGQLSLIEQGRFALGYYHQRAAQFREMAERRLEREAAAEGAARH
jgi:CRISPR-associated protein Csd1